MAEEQSYFYFSPGARAFFESKEEVEKCPVTRETLLPVNSLPFLQFINNKVCPLTYEDLEKDDPEILLFDPEKRTFTTKRYKSKLNPPSLNGKLIIDGNVTEFLTLDKFIVWKKKQEKPVYFIYDDGSYGVRQG